jgi:hypothetical protein
MLLETEKCVSFIAERSYSSLLSFQEEKPDIAKCDMKGSRVALLRVSSCDHTAATHGPYKGWTV